METIQHREYFGKYRSNTMASTSNNSTLFFSEEKTVTGRLYYKVIKSGTYHYRFLFSNIADSTFAAGENSRANLRGGEYEILCAFAGDSETTENTSLSRDSLQKITFDRQTGRHVGEGEVYWSDETELDIKEGHYLVFEWTVRGKCLPYTPDKLIPSFVMEENGEYRASCEFPQPQLIGCDADFERNILFLGDSITMGCGTSVDGYRFWAAHIARGLGDKYSMWNIGLGYGRAQDAASDGIWLEKARQYDTAVVCLGVNDILQGRTAEQIKSDLAVITDSLKHSGVSVCIFTLPAFNWEGKHRTTWDDVNRYIREVLAERADAWFDMASVSGNPDNRYASRDPQNGHPTDEVCAYIGQKFLEQFSAMGL